MGSFYSKLLSDMFSTFTTHVSVLQRKIITINTSSVNETHTENDVSNASPTERNLTVLVKPLMKSTVLRSNVGSDARPSIYIQIWNLKSLQITFTIFKSSKSSSIYNSFIT